MVSNAVRYCDRWGWELLGIIHVVRLAMNGRGAIVECRDRLSGGLAHEVYVADSYGLGRWYVNQLDTILATQTFHTFAMPSATPPRHNPNPACSYDAGRLDFAIHVRLGDRRLTQEAPDEYFSVLEALMDTITDSLLKRGLTPPVFHIFTETLQQCPSAETGIFHEMPGWPVELDQV